MVPGSSPAASLSRGELSAVIDGSVCESGGSGREELKR